MGAWSGGGVACEHGGAQVSSCMIQLLPAASATAALSPMHSDRRCLALRRRWRGAWRGWVPGGGALLLPQRGRESGPRRRGGVARLQGRSAIRPDRAAARAGRSWLSGAPFKPPNRQPSSTRSWGHRGSVVRSSSTARHPSRLMHKREGGAGEARRRAGASCRAMEARRRTPE